MLNKAIQLLKPDGTGVYATCAMTPVENEEVLGNFLNEIKIEQVEVKGDPGFGDIDPQLKNARRLLPSKYSCDGFFIAKFRRIN